MSIDEILILIQSVNLREDNNPCAKYVQTLQQKNLFVCQWGTRQLEIDATIAQTKLKEIGCLRKQ